jgi:hypothetical protein
MYMRAIYGHKKEITNCWNYDVSCMLTLLLIVKSENFKYLYLRTECIIPLVKD